MIVIDTSAIMAIAAGEVETDRCSAAIVRSDRLLMSTGTLAELMVVANGKNLETQVTGLLTRLTIEYLDVTENVAHRVGQIYRRWGKGFHPASLNFGDCFAYEAAISRNCPLLYVGQDFSRTDVISALPAA